jgi:hypothetical protein
VFSQNCTSLVEPPWAGSELSEGTRELLRNAKFHSPIRLETRRRANKYNSTMPPFLLRGSASSILALICPPSPCWSLRLPPRHCVFCLLSIYLHGTFRIEPLRKTPDRPSLEPSETCCLLHQDDASEVSSVATRNEINCIDAHHHRACSLSRSARCKPRAIHV